MRSAHIIKRNHNNETPNAFIFVGLHATYTHRRGGETVYRLEFGILRHHYSHDGGARWTSADTTISCDKEFWERVEGMAHQGKRTYVVVSDTNKTLALLDIFTGAYDAGWRCIQAVIENPPTIVRWRKGKRSIYLIDARNIWRELSTNTYVGASDNEKCADYDDNIRQRQEGSVSSGLTTLQEKMSAWCRFLWTEDLGGFAPTIASQAMRTFRHKYMHHNLLVDCCEDALRLARSAYKGARNECFYVGKIRGSFHLLDINSMYADIMRRMWVPTRLIGHSRHFSVQDLARAVISRVVVCRATVRTEQPVFCVRKDGKLVFPVGEFECTLAGDEVVYAIEQGLIAYVHEVAVYVGEPAFESFITDSWARRLVAIKAGDESTADKYKTLMAAFYGKWGQSGGVWSKIEDASNAEIKTWLSIDHDTKAITHFRQFAGIVQELGVEAESAESMPAIAACVTANARLQLDLLIELAGRENVLYVDTDALLVNDEGLAELDSMIAPYELGKLKLEGSFTDITINTCKDYRFGSRVKLKGVQKSAVMVEDSTYICDQQKSLSAMMRSGIMSAATNYRISKKIVRTYDKGVIQPDGYVNPIRRQR